MPTALKPAFSLLRAQVGSGRLRQHELAEFEQGSAWVMAMALGPPRLWSYLLDATIAGFAEGYARPHDGRASTRLHQGLRAGQQTLRARVEALIERRMPDAGLLALSLEDGVLHVVGAGPLRAYVLHPAGLRRLAAKDDSPKGLLRGSISWCAEQVERGELCFAGSLSACSETALDALADVLVAEPKLSPEQVVETLNGPAAESGVGAVALAVRVPAVTPTPGPP